MPSAACEIHTADEADFSITAGAGSVNTSMAQSARSRHTLPCLEVGKNEWNR